MTDANLRPPRWPLRVIAGAVSALTLMVTTAVIYLVARQGAAPSELVHTWRPAMIIAALSLLTIAMSRTYYVIRLNEAEKLRIEQLAATRDQLLEATAHELRNPLAGIKGILTIIRRRLQTGQPIEQIFPLIDIAEGEADRTTVFLNDFIDAFQAQHGRMALTKEPLLLTQVISAALAVFRPLLEETGCHQLVLRGMDLEGVVVIGDPLRLEQVVRNLLNNAIAYSPAGGVITVSMEVSTTTAVISVQDQGLGIPEDELSSIFDCFHRARNVADDDPGGTGLGLYIARNIVESHGGRIWAKSPEERGATFFVELPLRSDQTQATKSQDHPPVPD